MPIKKLRNTDHLYERISADGRLIGYPVKICKKGFPPQIGSFDYLEEAKRFVREVQSDQIGAIRLTDLSRIEKPSPT